MKRKSILLTFIFLYLVGCSPRERITGPERDGSGLGDYLPLKVGNTWTYSALSANGPGDTSSSGPVTITIYQTDVLIGGQPNTFIIRTDKPEEQVSYLAFCVNGNTLLHYLGGSKTFLLQDNVIRWIPGGIGGAVVGVDRSRKYHITEESGDSRTFLISRSPDSSIARAEMTSTDTVQITGIREGQTAFTLQDAGGGAGDTMTVLIGVSTDPPSTVTSPFLPWMPLWQLADSSSAGTMYSTDTTFAFKRTGDGAECTDELYYLLTNRFVGGEPVQFQGSALRCDRFRMKITLMETITCTDSTGSNVLFSGTSTDFTVDMWLAKGVGFVKGIVVGSSLPPVAAMGGETDSSGALDGFYISPRVGYASIPLSGETRREYFFVNAAPLDTTATLSEFNLMSKNF